MKKFKNQYCPDKNIRIHLNILSETVIAPLRREGGWGEAKWLFAFFIAWFLFSCNNKSSSKINEHEVLYTCPMPADSFFSDKPGKCPKCRMTLVKAEDDSAHADHVMKKDSVVYESGYTCPMHPTVHSDTAGTCPICGMQLERVKPIAEARSVSLDVLLKPQNQQVVASVPMVHIMDREENIEMEAYGFVTYDTRQVGVISSYVAGRIEKLYVKYRFQKINKGQKIMDIYSPELMTAQENLLFLMKNDPENKILINASRQKLLLLGMSNREISRVIQSGKASYKVSVFSNYTGHVHEAGKASEMSKNQQAGMQDFALTTPELTIKEGMYLQRGQNVFSVFNSNKAWAVLNIFAGQAGSVKVGDKVRITPETNSEKDFKASISYIEPFYREGSKTLTARVYFDNSNLDIPIGSQVKATVFGGNRSASWLPEEAVLSLGMDKVVFVRIGESFIARKIETGIVNKHLIQVLNGLNKNEAVAANAQYLVDSESFIKTNQ